MFLPSMPFVVLIIGAASVTVTAAAGLHNRRPVPASAAVAKVAVTPERAACDAFNRAVVEATARARDPAEAARLRGLEQDCSRVARR